MKLRKIKQMLILYTPLYAEFGLRGLSCRPRRGAIHLAFGSPGRDPSMEELLPGVAPLRPAFHDCDDVLHDPDGGERP